MKQYWRVKVSFINRVRSLEKKDFVIQTNDEYEDASEIQRAIEIAYKGDSKNGLVNVEVQSVNF